MRPGGNEGAVSSVHAWAPENDHAPVSSPFLCSQYGLATGLRQALELVLKAPVSFKQAQEVLAQATGHDDWEDFHRYSRRDHTSLDPEALSAQTLKQLVKGLRKALVNVLDESLPQHQAQEVLAQALGYPHWFALTQKAVPSQVRIPLAPADPYDENGEYSAEHKAAVAHLLNVQDDGRDPVQHLPARTPSPRAAIALAQAFDLASYAGAVGLTLTLLDSQDEDTSSGDLQISLEFIQENGTVCSFWADELAEMAAHLEQRKRKNEVLDPTSYGLAPQASLRELAMQMETWEATHWDLAIQEPTRWLPVLNRTLALDDRAHWVGMVAGPTELLPASRTAAPRRRGR